MKLTREDTQDLMYYGIGDECSKSDHYYILNDHYYILNDHYDYNIHKDNNIYKIENYSNKYSKIKINITNLNRLIKIYNITNQRFELLEHVKWFELNRIDNIIEHVLVDELSESIDKDILRKIKK